LLHGLTEQLETVVIDMEAGLEHLSRGTARYVDTLLLLAEPYFKSLETAARAKTLAEELGIPRIVAVANKSRGAQDEEAIRRFFSRVGLPLVSVIPADDTILEADRHGRSPLDYAATAPAVLAMTGLADILVSG
jgi:CO dehydrogenase maturation factor